MYTTVTRCRACGFGQPLSPGGIKSAASDQQLIPVLDLGLQPLANDFVQVGAEQAGFAPLKVLFCPECSLAQLSVVVRPDILYSRYSYVTSPGSTMRKHFEAILADICSEITPGSVVEIGSNDGLLLAFLSDHGFGNSVGIEPAANLAARANKNGIFTLHGFFDLNAAKAAGEAAGGVDLVIARHVFCHINDWHSFIASLDALCQKNTLVCIEVPCVENQLSSGSFDQIYHEHLSYMTLRSIKSLLHGTVFHIHRVLHYPVHGGAIVVMLRRNDSGKEPHPSAIEEIGHEDISFDRWKKFGERSELQIMELKSLIVGLANSGARICGYGASAKSTVWINAMRLTRKELCGVYDGTAEKLYCMIPGTDIPVIHEGAFYADACNYAVLFAWNYLDEVIAKQSKWLEQGGKFIVPVPKLRTIGVDSESGGA